MALTEESVSPQKESQTNKKYGTNAKALAESESRRIQAESKLRECQQRIRDLEEVMESMKEVQEGAQCMAERMADVYAENDRLKAALVSSAPTAKAKAATDDIRALALAADKSKEDIAPDGKTQVTKRKVVGVLKRLENITYAVERKEAVSNLEGEQYRLMLEVQELRHQLETARKEAFAAKSSLHDAKSEAAERTRELEELRAMYEAVLTEAADMHSRLGTKQEHARNVAESLESQLALSKAKAIGMEAEIEQLRKALEDAQQQAAEDENDKDDLGSVLLAQERALREACVGQLEEQLRTCRQESRQLAGSLQSCRDECTRLRTDAEVAQAWKEQVNELEKEADTLRREAKVAQEDLDAMQQDYAVKMHALEQELRASKEQAAKALDLTKSLDAATADTLALKVRLNKASKEHRRAASDSANLRRRLHELLRTTRDKDDETARMNALRSGTVLVKHNFGKAGRSLRFIALSSDGMSLCWGDPNKRKINPRSSVPLAQVKEIVYGPYSEVFRKQALIMDLPWHCFSLVLGTRTLDLCATSDSQVSTWLLGLSTAIANARSSSSLMDTFSRMGANITGVGGGSGAPNGETTSVAVPSTEPLVSLGRMLWQRARLKITDRATSTNSSIEAVLRALVDKARTATAVEMTEQITTSRSVTPSSFC
mmetsp:Transcript_265/g.505  ORF Transcript_265/g.505 Transcript_265/m.505 type:complete len:661 (+) Transcript_265:263-2245(+)|eukprot:CAMPEP_0184666946 /NCGR_PEP_ID=MMETSP0308-20130426/64710_1 /TAXON_ID=38269 /ORGANISM="Gloeochaete witrockiana, Strain SAG 46.84" /LENGTH=660 /DNA_ID=CAMNT_0027111865 /DNA_START=140 /DNA_END=2122 /DNA_ORIENTATION=+